MQRLKIHTIPTALLPIILLLAPAAPAHAADGNPVQRAESLQESAKTLAVSLSGQLGRTTKKLAVTDLVKLNDTENLLGAQLAEELTSALFHENKKITLVERRRLQAAINELRLSSGAMFDASNARRIGKFVGADAVVIGSLFASGDINVVVRVIKVETGDVLAAASVSLAAKPEYLAALVKPMARPVQEVAPPKPASRPVAETGASPLPADSIFVEDFRGVKEGAAPERWLGTDHFSVVFDKRGTPVFQAYEAGAARFSASRIAFPSGDFSVEWIVSREQGNCANQPNMLIIVGNMTAGAESQGCGRYTAVLNNSRGEVEVAAGTPHRFELKREGVVFTLWMDGTKLLMARKPDFTPGDTLLVNLDANHRSVNAGKLYSVTVRKME